VRWRILAVLTLIVLLPRPAAAEWLLSPFVGLRFAADTTLLFAVDIEAPDKKKLLWGVSGALLTDGVLGLELDFSYVPGFFDSDRGLIASSRVITLSGNVIAAMPRTATAYYGLRPYVSGGLGLMHAASRGQPDFDVLVIDSNFLALNLGGGAIGPVSPRSSIRFDLRHFRNMKTDEEAPVLAPGAQLSFWRGTVGLSVRLGS
jgi:hypothetical protein